MGRLRSFCGPDISREVGEEVVLLLRTAVAFVSFFVIRLSRGRMTKKDGLFGALPRVAAAAQPDPGLSYIALTGLQIGASQN